MDWLGGSPWTCEDFVCGDWVGGVEWWCDGWICGVPSGVLAFINPYPYIFHGKAGMSGGARQT